MAEQTYEEGRYYVAQSITRGPVVVVRRDTLNAHYPWLVLDDTGGRVSHSNLSRINEIKAVLIDPEDRESVQRLYDVLGAGDQDSWWPRDLIGFTAALRQFATPKLEEPTGRFTEVVNAEGMTYYRAPTGTWHRSTDNLERPWDQIGAVRVVSEGGQS